MAQGGEAEQIKRRVKNSRDTQSCLRVVVMFSLLCNIENKVTILLPKYRDLTLDE